MSLPMNDGPRAGMVRVTASQPCPVCGKPDYSGVSADGRVAACMRVESGKTARNGGHVHLHSDPAALPAPSSVKTAVPSKDWSKVAAGYAADLDAHRRAKLAATPGLPPGALDLLPSLGFHECDPAGPCFTFPEVDAIGVVIGINRRFADGTKKMIAGGRRGLTLPGGRRDRPGRCSSSKGRPAPRSAWPPGWRASAGRRMPVAWPCCPSCSAT